MPTSDDAQLLSIIQGSGSQVRARTTLGLDANPDDAARAVDLSSATGVPATVINGDLEHFDKQYQGALARSLVLNNPQLRDYVNSHPLAAEVSNDDWGNLSSIADATSAFGRFHQALSQMWPSAQVGQAETEGFKEGFGQGPLFPVSREGLAQQYPALTPGRTPFSGVENLLATLGLNTADLALRGTSGIFSAVTSGLGAMVGEAAGPSAGREAKALAEYEVIKPEGGIHMELSAEPPGTPWVKAGEEPPAGLHPEIDKAKANLNEQGLKALEDTVKQAQTSTTKERSPELFQKFFQQFPELRNGSISINGDAVAQLYRDKPPAPDDGLLGWVPGIADKLELAKASGGDVEVPIADWISQVDPAVAKSLHDFVRLWDGGITAAESRFPTPIVKPDSDLAQVRQAAGLNPVVAPEDFANLKASGVDLPQSVFDKLVEDLSERQASDLAKTQAFAEREQARRQTKEWKDNSVAMRPEVEESIRQSPPVAADLFVGAGELNGEKLRQRFPLLERDMTPEQQASLPDHYVSKTGIPIDEAARVLGFGSGDSLIEALAVHVAARGEDSPKVYFDKLVASETNRRMETQYGKLPENILAEAKAQALSESTLNLLTDEYMAAALRANVTAVDRATIQAQAEASVATKPLRDIKPGSQMAETGRHFRDAQRALIENDKAAALQAMQRRVLSAFMTKRMMEVEKAKEQTLALFKTLKKIPQKSTDNPSLGREPEYVNYLHQIMIQVGVGVPKRSIQGIEADIAARGTGTLQQFAERKAGDLREMPVWDQLFDKTWSKPLEELKVEDFMALHDTVKSMDFHARNELKITKGLDKVNLADLKEGLKRDLQRFPELKYTGRDEERAGRFGYAPWRIPRGFLARNIQMEMLLNTWDKFDQWGDWNQSVMRGLIDGANQAERWEKDYVKELGALDDKADLTKSVDNPIFRNQLVPDNKGELIAFTRENLRAIMLKSGNSAGKKSNLWKLAGGYKLEPQVVMDWIHQHATKEDWDWAQGVWDNVWASIKEKGDTMFRSESGGVAPDSVKLTPIQTKFGTYKGGYFPANDWHPLFEGRSAKLSGENSLMQKQFVSATSPPGWTETRTAQTSIPQRLDLSNMANLIKQHLHDIAMRPAIVNASKIMMDNDIKNMVKLHVGAEYSNLMKSYLVGVANRVSYSTLHPDYANSFIEKARLNLVTTLIGWNLSTVAKHMPTAMMNSIKEVGPEYYLKAVRSMYAINDVTGDINKKFLDDNFLELSRRSRNWQETLYGEMADQTGASKFETLRQEVARLSSTPVAASDMFSARPTALAGYLRAIDEGKSHGDAIYAGERAVRRAHGSTATTNRPQIMRDTNPWITSIYNFWNDMFNRQLETVWKAGEMVREQKAEGWEVAKKRIPDIAASTFTFVIWPAIVEHAVLSIMGGQKQDPNESWTKKALGALVHTESSTLPYVRDFANFMFEGGEPSMGLIGTGMKELRNAIGDFGKKQPFSPKHAERMIHDWTGLAGMVTGMLPQAVGNAAGFGYGVASGYEHPKGPWGWLAGMKSGTLAHRPSTLANWWGGKSY